MEECLKPQKCPKLVDFENNGGDVRAEAASIETSALPKILLNQTLAIQLAFDAKYLLQLLSHRGTSEDTKKRMDIKRGHEGQDGH